MSTIQSGVYNLLISVIVSKDEYLVRPINVDDKGVVVITGPGTEAMKWRVDANDKGVIISYLKPGAGAADGLNLSLGLGSKLPDVTLSLLSSGKSDLLTSIHPDGEQISSAAPGSPGYTWAIQPSAYPPPPAGDYQFVLKAVDKRSWVVIDPPDIAEQPPAPMRFGDWDDWPVYFKRVDEKQV